MTIKSFRGKLADDTVQEIRLSTIKGITGYKVIKFELLPVDASEDIESVVQIYTVSQDAARNTINFDDPTLLAAGIVRGGTGVSQPLTQITVFDTIKFNQDIFITLKGADYTASVNYVLELEQMQLNLDEATSATLKDMRGNYTNQDP